MRRAAVAVVAGAVRAVVVRGVPVVGIVVLVLNLMRAGNRILVTTKQRCQCMGNSAGKI